MMMMMAMMVQPTVWKKWRIWRIQYSGYGGYGGWGYGIRWWIVLSVLLVRSMYNTLLLLLLGPNRVPIPIPTTRRLTRASAVRTSLQAFVQEPIHQQRCRYYLCGLQYEIIKKTMAMSNDARWMHH